MATYGSATSLSLVSPGLSHWVGTTMNLISSENTATSRFFDWGGNAGNGVEITSNNRIYVNSSDNTGNPTHVRVNGGNWASDVAISNGDTVNFSHDGSAILATWVVTSSHLWTQTTGGAGGGSAPSSPVELYRLHLKSYPSSFGKSLSVYYMTSGDNGSGDTHRIEQWRNGTLVHAGPDTAFGSTDYSEGLHHWWNYPNAETTTPPERGDEFRMIFTLLNGNEYIAGKRIYGSKVNCNFW